MSDRKTTVDTLLKKENWRQERKKLRQIILNCGLREDVKWGKLCYTFKGGNVAIIYGLKRYCAVGFFKGSLLADDDDVLISPGKHSQAMRQMRFCGLEEINNREATLTAYLEKAIQAEKDGLEVEFDEERHLSYPDELQAAFDDDAGFEEAFGKLTPGRRRGYIMHFADAKQSKTRTSRIGKYKPKILDGRGFNER